MEEEEWRDIPGYENIYLVSSFGNIKSIKFNKEKILKLDKKSKGYNQINLFKDGIKKKFLIHRLVAMAFLDTSLLANENYVVNHKDGIRDNNNVNNLEIITKIENTLDGVIRKFSEEDLKMNNIKYISKNNWEVYYKDLFLGYVKNTNEAFIAINTAKILFEYFNK